MKKDIFILYIIRHKSKPYIKIGKTRQSFKHNRYKDIDDHFKGILPEKSFYVESYNEKEISNLERILHKIFYREREPQLFSEGIGKTEWFKDKILDDVFKQIKELRKQKNFKGLSRIQKDIGIESSYLKRNFKLRFFFFLLFFIIGFVSSLYLKTS